MRSGDGRYRIKHPFGCGLCLGSGRCDGLTYLGFAMQIEIADILEAFRRLSDIQLIALSGAVGYLLGDIGYRLFLRSRIQKRRGSNND